MRLPGLTSLTTLICFVVLNFVSTTALAQRDCEEVLLRSNTGYGYGDGVGTAVAASGNHAVIGAYWDSWRDYHAGAVYPAQYTGTEWVVGQRIYADDASDRDEFGSSVAVWGNLMVVGAPENEENGPYEGAAYVFEFDGGRWRQVTKLLASGIGTGWEFGQAVAVAGNTILVGTQDEMPFGDYAGAVYVFEYDGSAWVETDKLVASGRAARDHFGSAIAMTHDTAVIGAYGDDDLGKNSGSAYIFKRDGSGWHEEVKLRAADGAAAQEFGEAVAISGNRVLIGARSDTANGKRAGAAYVFSDDGTGWREDAKLLAPDGVEYESFGSAVAILDRTLLVGTPADDEGGYLSGSTHAFYERQGRWTYGLKIRSTDSAEHQGFGAAVALTDSSALVGAAFLDDSGPSFDAVYAYDLPCLWSPCLELEVSNLVAGESAEFRITGGTPGARALTVYGSKKGQTVVKGYGGYCATFGIQGVNQSRIVGGTTRWFRQDGTIVFRVFIAGGLAGQRVLFQSAEAATCPKECVSEVLEMVVE